MTKNDWLSPETKAQAIKKLDAMKLLIGYPDDYSNLYRDYQFDSKASSLKITIATNTCLKNEILKDLTNHINVMSGR
ncbi:hypothetical protein [Streptococcus gallinaceus]|uniref:hypothetical protein n=1 Tax=Streptococcus gallinaceus TaxID=165758 RepID=UPI0033975839